MDIRMMRFLGVAAVAAAFGSASAETMTTTWFAEDATTFATALGAAGQSPNGTWSASDAANFGETTLAWAEGGKVVFDTTDAENVTFAPTTRTLPANTEYRAVLDFDAAKDPAKFPSPDGCFAGILAAKSDNGPVYAYLSGGAWAVSEVPAAVGQSVTVVIRMDFAQRKMTYAIANGETETVIAADAVIPEGKTGLSSVVASGSGSLTSMDATYAEEVVAKIGDVPYASFEAAVDSAKTGETVTLQTDLNLASTFALDDGRALTVDLNGKTVTSAMSDSSYAFYVLDGSKLVLTNGTITLACRGVCSEGEAELRNIRLTSSNRPLGVYYVGAKAGKASADKAGSMLIDKDSVITQTADGTGSCVLFIQGSTMEPYEGVAKVDVYGKLVDLNPGNVYGTITENAGKPSKVEINLYDGGELSSARGFAIFNSEGGVINLYGGKVDGAIELVSGKINVPADSTVTVETKMAKADFVDKETLTGDAIWLVNADYPCGAPTGDIRGGTFKSANGSAIATYGQGGAVATEAFVSGGLFGNEIAVEVVEEGFKAVPAESDLYTVGPDALPGTGTEADPFVIGSRRHLKAFRNGVNDGTYGQAGTYYVQTADIDLAGIVWTDIGTGLQGSGIPFNGNYDGQGHVVSNFVLSGVSYCGFFNAMQGGSVRNLSLLDVTSPAGCSAVSVLAGDVEPPADVKVVYENVTVSGTITGTHNVGGFNAWLQGAVDFINCTNLVNCLTTRAKTGGFTPIYKGNSATAGLMMSNCCNRGSVTMHKNLHLDATSAAGGLVAYTQGVSPMTFVNCVNEGEVSVLMDDLGNVDKYYGSAYVGGVLGEITGGASATFKSCANTGTVSAPLGNVTNENAFAGGLLGGTTIKTIAVRFEDCAVASTVSAVGSAGKTTAIGSFVGAAGDAAVTATGVNTAKAGLLSVGNGAGQTANLNFATVSGDVATFVADASVGAGSSVKVMTTLASKAVVFADKDDVLVVDTTLNPAFEADVTPPEGYVVKKTVAEGVKTYALQSVGLKPGEEIPCATEDEARAKAAETPVVIADEKAAKAGQAQVVKAAAVKTKDGAWVVAVVIDTAAAAFKAPDVIVPALADTLTDIAAGKATSVSVSGANMTPGLYYSIMGDADVGFGNPAEGVRVLADGTDKALTVPSISGGKAFFKVVENITDKPANP